MEAACNIELKARLRNLPAARQIAQRLATNYLGVQQQTDTYFHCTQARLKLREIVDFGDQQSSQPAEQSTNIRSAVQAFLRTNYYV